MKKINLKVLIGIIAMLVIISGVLVYAINNDNENETTIESSINDEKNNVVAKNDEVEKKDSKEVSKEQEKAKKDNNTEKDKKNLENNKSEAESKKDTPKNTTYTSEKLGVSFDMPASWYNKYYVEDNEKEILVYTKHSDNNKGVGLLFTITTDIEKTEFMDTIYGIDKEQTINGKKFAVGGPTDFRMYENDPLNDLYRKMVSECKDVLSTLR